MGLAVKRSRVYFFLYRISSVKFPSVYTCRKAIETPGWIQLRNI